jgi:hypothetical protein
MEFSTPAEEARIRSEWVRQIKSLQDSCHATFINADWAFNANTQTGSEIHGKSPLWTLKMVEDGCTYHPAGDSLTISPNLDFAVLFHLDAGQEHNADARFHYRQCRNSHASPLDFVLFIAKCATIAPDFGEAGANIFWQRGASGASILAAHNHWAASQRMVNPEAKKYFEITAMFYLLSGQHHNGAAMRGYRACFREDATRLFSMV